MVELKIIKANKYIDDEQKTHLEQLGQKCLYGFCWWEWIPRFRVGLRTIEANWLCYSFVLARQL